MSAPDAVVLLRYPVALGMRNAEHLDEVLREFRLVQLGRDAGTTSCRDVPARLLEMVDMLTRTYNRELSEPDRMRAQAAARGDAVVDLTYPVRPETEQVARGWQAMLAEVDDFCRSQDLLTLARPAELVALNDWALGEFVRQVRGEAPRPWSGSLT